jgi:hypothetical protein
MTLKRAWKTQRAWPRQAQFFLSLMHTPDTSIPEAEAQGRRLGDSIGPSSSAFISSTVWHGAGWYRSRAGRRTSAAWRSLQRAWTGWREGGKEVRCERSQRRRTLASSWSRAANYGCCSRHRHNPGTTADSAIKDPQTRKTKDLRGIEITNLRRGNDKVVSQWIMPRAGHRSQTGIRNKTGGQPV